MHKSIPGSLRGSQNRPKIDAGSVFGVTKVPKELPATIRSVPDAPRDRPGSDPRIPKNVAVTKGSSFGVPRGVLKRAEAINFDVNSPPGAKNSFLFSHGWVPQARRSDFSALRAASWVARVSHPRKTSKIR